MTAELVRGQNHPLSQARLEVRISAGGPVMAGATLGDEQGRVRDTEWVAHPGTPALPGLEVSRQAAAEHRLAVDLDAMPQAVHRIHVLLALPPVADGPGRFGVLAAPFVAVTGLDGAEIASYTVTGLDSESAVVALEFYRRQGAWKVRAVGQGYAGGLAALLADQGLPQAHQLAALAHEAVVQGLARSVAVPPPRPTGADRTRHGAAAGSGHHGAAADAGQTSVSGTGFPHQPSGVPTGQDPVSGAAAQDSRPGTSVGPGSAASAAGSRIDYTHRGRSAATPPPSAGSSSAVPPPGGNPPTAPPAAGERTAGPVAGDATGWSMDERLYNQVWGMFEDLSRSTAAYRSAVDFADSRRDQELDQALSDPRGRIGGQADAARETARARHAQLVDQAKAAYEQDLAQLTAEYEVVEPALPPAYARWDSPVWQAYQVPAEMPMAVRLGDLHLPESGSLRIPMLLRLPLERGLWIDSAATASAGGVFLDSGNLRRLALETAVAHAARLLAVHPAGEFGVHVVDAAGAGAQALAPLAHSGVPVAPPAPGAAGVAEVLARLARRVDLVQMALRSGAVDALPPEVDTAQQLLIVNDFPHGFDDRAVTQLRYLADEGPAAGVHLVMVADRQDASAYGPLLDPLWRSLLRLTPVADDHLADPWVGHAWTYEPSLVPAGSRVLEQVLTRVGAARRDRGR